MLWPHLEHPTPLANTFYSDMGAGCAVAHGKTGNQHCQKKLCDMPQISHMGCNKEYLPTKSS